MSGGAREDSTGRGRRARLEENAVLRAENLALRELCLAHARERQQAAREKAQLDEILGSRAWAFVQTARRFAAAVGLGTVLRARGSRAGSRVIAQSATWCDPGACTQTRPTAPGLKVSVIVPNYNHAPYIEERLRSVFAQTYPPHEVLFLDDASSDESLAVARRLALESPVPVRFLLNESNSGSPFRQWLKGIDLARGDLVWIAESDDTCRRDLLERLVAPFDDPDVMLAYCQSAMISHDGRPFAADYLDATEDLSPVRWRYPYCVPGHDEVERALSQRNTIPNASAVLFRKPARIEERADLETLRLCGDWLFYAMRIRRGKIAYVPEPLNGHRHHGGTVRSAFERAVELFEEQLQVKARIFESFPVTASAIASSLARGFADYVDRTRQLGPRPAMTEHPRLAPHLDRLRNLFWARVPARQDARLLIVLSGVTMDPEQREMIRLANELSGRWHVFLCNALPRVLDPAAAARLDSRIVPLEGSLGLMPWSWEGEPCRAEVIRELIEFHQIDAIHSQGPWADRLLAAAGLDLRIAPPPGPPVDLDRLDESGVYSRAAPDRHR